MAKLGEAHDPISNPFSQHNSQLWRLRIRRKDHSRATPYSFNTAPNAYDERHCHRPKHPQRRSSFHWNGRTRRIGRLAGEIRIPRMRSERSTRAHAASFDKLQSTGSRPLARNPIYSREKVGPCTRARDCTIFDSAFCTRRGICAYSRGSLRFSEASTM